MSDDTGATTRNEETGTAGAREPWPAAVNEGVPETSIEYEDLANEKHISVDYPLRSPKEDQRWAVNTVRLWSTIVSGVLIFTTVMLILGVIYD